MSAAQLLLCLAVCPGAARAAEGAASITPTTLAVDVKSTVDYLYEVGPSGMGVGDRIRIIDPVFHGMRWSRWSVAQTRPDQCSPKSSLSFSVALVTAQTSGGAELSLERSTTDPEIHEYAWTDVTVSSGRLEPGQVLRVRYGDESSDTRCGHQMPDRAYQSVPWPSYEWLDGQATWQPLEPTPTFSMRHQPDPGIVHVAAPSVVGVGEDFELTVGVLDALGNPMISWEGGVTTGLPGQEVTTPLLPGAGALTVSARFDAPGIYRVPAHVEGLTGLSNPIEVLAEPPAMRVYWGDLHTHHGHSYVDEEGSRVDENHVYARDVMGLDLGCESMKASPIEIDGEALWETMQANCREYTEEGRYVSMLGVEWMSTDDGHHNLYFDSCEVPFGDHRDMVRLAGRGSTFAWMDTLFAERGVRSVAIPHASMYTGHNWTDVDDSRRTIAEVYSGWGSSMELDGRPGSIQEALSGGNRVGFLGASDNHKGWMGNLVSIRRFQPGMGAFWAPALTYQDIFETLEQRRTYATTGPRILLRFEATDGEQRFQPGEDFTPSASGPTFTWAAHGTESIARVTLFSVAEDGRMDVVPLDKETPEQWDASGSFTWEDVPRGSHAVWVEVLQTDGNRAWSTPIWVNSRGCGGCGGGGSAALLLPMLLLWGRGRGRR